MAGIVETFMNDAPLDGGVMVVVHGDVFLATPAKAAVVDDDVSGILYTDGTTVNEAALLIVLVGFALLTFQLLDTQTRTDVADDDILGTAQV